MESLPEQPVIYYTLRMNPNSVGSKTYLAHTLAFIWVASGTAEIANIAGKFD